MDGAKAHMEAPAPVQIPLQEGFTGSPRPLRAGHRHALKAVQESGVDYWSSSRVTPRRAGWARRTPATTRPPLTASTSLPWSSPRLERPRTPATRSAELQ
ncbi:hypothetical protein QJS66_02270 [Kocuria rhizophila]|nr:hypothetical protein QJS66_02270 [Kocuria rhizophila]